MTSNSLLQKTLIDSFRKHAERPAIWCENESINYRELHERVSVLAAHIMKTCPRDARIGIASQRDFASIIGILAVIVSGRAYVPLNPAYPVDRLRSIVEIAGIDLVLATPETAQRIVDTGVSLSILVSDGCNWRDAHGLAIPGEPFALEPVSVDNAAYFMFTSGTTGVPKGVRVDFGNLEAYLQNISAIADISANDKCSHFFELSFDLSVHDLFVTFSCGAELVVLPKKATLDIVDFVNERGITCWFSVPSLASYCDRVGGLKPGALNHLRLALFCGEALPVTLARKFATASPNAAIFNIYGPTEATIAFTFFEYTDGLQLEDLTIVPIGQPFGDLRVDYLPFEGGLELALGGAQVTPGYINNDEEQAAKFYVKEGTRWYRTGDAVDRDEKLGTLFLGRIDDQVKVNGYRVELAEIDACLRSAAGSPEAASLVWAGSDGSGPAEIIGFVVGSDLSSGAIRKAARKLLPNYMVPRKVISLDRMPTNSSGKIDRKALKAMLRAD